MDFCVKHFAKPVLCNNLYDSIVFICLFNTLKSVCHMTGTILNRKFVLLGTLSKYVLLWKL